MGSRKPVKFTAHDAELLNELMERVGFTLDFVIEKELFMQKFMQAFAPTPKPKKLRK